MPIPDVTVILAGIVAAAADGEHVTHNAVAHSVHFEHYCHDSLVDERVAAEDARRWRCPI